MKKIFVLLVFIFFIKFVNANPLVPPPIISELYIVNDSTWYLELVFSNWNITSFDDLKITTTNGSSFFKNGILIAENGIIVITQDSLNTPLLINRNGDFILIQDTSGGYVLGQLSFGSISDSQISAPLVGQSIVNYAYNCFIVADGNRIEYHIVKDNNPTIGTLANCVSSTAIGTFTGIVYDNEHHPIPEVRIGDIQGYFLPENECRHFLKNAISDSTGKFTVDQYSGRYSVDLFLSSILLDSTINIEPDSINYFEFTIDTLLSNINFNSIQTNINLSCFPNPSKGETTISFELPVNNKFKKALVKIYNLNNEIISILPVSINSFNNKYSIKWDGLSYGNNIDSGTYCFSLELEGRKIASSKIIIAK